MSPEEKELLQATLTLAEENNKMLHKVRGVQNRLFVWRIVKIIIILGIAFGSFYFLEPYLEKVMGLYSSVTGIEQKLSDSPLQGLLNNL